eukprot:TRINITY_DN113504_c0_g1_i1.p1 TRINITY_DN113504_c0_g1~~TRINITY_DN113504_c0_g1_i1.p1  ORF type:complete len:171 (-),score=4.35 TRINITY_DN113504_c0_g1_i1:97-537(-)
MAVSDDVSGLAGGEGDTPHPLFSFGYMYTGNSSYCQGGFPFSPIYCNFVQGGVTWTPSPNWPRERVGILHSILTCGLVNEPEQLCNGTYVLSYWTLTDRIGHVNSYGGPAQYPPNTTAALIALNQWQPPGKKFNKLPTIQVTGAWS